MSVWALLAAAGAGERLGLDRPKAFARLGGRPLLAESLERLDASEWVDAIVVAAPPSRAVPRARIPLAGLLHAARRNTPAAASRIRSGCCSGPVWADWSPVRRLTSLRATRMPRPPPPAAALISTG